MLLGVRKLSEDCEKLFRKLVWSSYLGWLGMQFGGNIVIIIIIVLLHFIHGVVFKVTPSLFVMLTKLFLINISS